MRANAHFILANINSKYYTITVLYAIVQCWDRLSLLSTRFYDFSVKFLLIQSDFLLSKIMTETANKLTGLAKHFNSETMYGRANVSNLTSKQLWMTTIGFCWIILLISERIFECLIIFPGDKGDICRYRTDHSILCHEIEE